MTRPWDGRAASKRAIREAALGARRALRDVGALSRQVHENLFRLDEFNGAREIECYAAMRDEVQTEAIIRRSLASGVRVLVPVVDVSRRELVFSELRDYSELEVGHFGVLEPRKESLRPTATDRVTTWLVPLVAWDDRGYRIGYGMGYFDRALAALPRGVSTVGLAFELQRVERIPEAPHDIPLKMLVTERRVIRFGGYRGDGEGSSSLLRKRGMALTLEREMLLNGSFHTPVGRLRMNEFA